MIYFVGGGVGTADYLTVAAAHVLRKADLILYSKYLDKDVLKFCKKGCRLVCFSDLPRQKVDIMLAENRKHLTVYLANGDFACYGTVQDHFDFCRANYIPFKVIPGVSSLGAATSVIANELVLPNISNSLIVTYMDSEGNLMMDQSIEALASHRATMAIHMVEPGMYSRLKSRLIKGGYPEYTPIVIVQEALRSGETVISTTIKELDVSWNFSWMSLVLVGDVFVDPEKRKSISRLPFTTEFRRAERYNLCHMRSGIHG